MIEVKSITAVSECGKTFYGGEVYLNGTFIKYIPLTDKKKVTEQYLNLLRDNLKYYSSGGFDFVDYVCPKTGEILYYWNSVPFFGAD